MTKQIYQPHKVRPNLTKKMKSYQIVTTFLNVRGNKRDLSDLGAQLKGLCNISLSKEVLDRVEKLYPVTTKVVWGNPFPQTVQELGEGENKWLYEPTPLDNEIKWALYGLQQYSKELRDFIGVRDQVERNILLGNFYEAENLLELSVRKFGYSVWYYEMKMTIAGFHDDLKKLFSIISNVNQAKHEQKGGIVQLILSDLLNRSQHSMNPLEYDNFTYARYKSTRTDLQSDSYSYFLFRLNYYQHSDVEGMASMLPIENLNSAIDRYSLMLYVLRSYYANDEKGHQKVIHYAKQLYKITLDKQLLPFIALSDINSLPDTYYEPMFVNILDNYYTGNYQGAVDLCRKYISNEPYNFEAIRIYCRALMFIGKGYQPICDNKDSFLYEIAFYVFKVMTGTEIKSAIDKLNQICMNLYGLAIAPGLDFFIKDELNQKHSDYLWFFSMTRFDPFFTKIYKDNNNVYDDKRRLAYLERGLQHIPESIAIDYHIHKVKRLITEDNAVVEYIRKVDNAKITFHNGNYEEAILQWKSILNENSSHTPTVQTAVDYIFRSILALGIKHRQEAVNFYIEQYMTNRSFVLKVDTRQFMKELNKTRYAGLQAGYDIILFVFLNAETYPQKQYVLQRYFKYMGVSLPSQLIKTIRHNQKAKVEQIFRILLKEDILYHHYTLKSTIDVLEEKLKLTNYLTTEYPDKKEYSNIHSELMQEIKAYRGMKKLDDSKIYVNVDAVMKYELCDISPLFEKFKKQAELNRNSNSILVVSGFNICDKNSFKDLLDGTLNYSKNAVSDVANQLFSRIRHAFLKSRFGLGTYLSTRIRHGVFEGELRSGLERLNLVLSLDQDEYVMNHYWLNNYNFSKQEKDKLVKILQDFSRKVDNLILGFKDNVIQIRENDKDLNKGEFTYIIPEETINEKMLDLEEGCDNSEMFCRKVIDYLWEITEQNLKVVREKVKYDLTPNFFNLLKDLEQKANEFSCYKQFYQEFHKIWFYWI